jgi:hypothetical protein
MHCYVDIPDATPNTHWTALAAAALHEAIHHGEELVLVSLPLRRTQDGTALSIIRAAAAEVAHADD